MKRTLCILLCVLMAVGVFSIVPAGAADTSSSATGAGDYIYFDANGWKNFHKVYCHIWVVGGDSIYGWQTGDEECQKDKGTVYKYDLSKASLESGKDYCVIFSTNTGVYTYDLTMGTECKGDTAYLTGNKIENPVDSKKKGDEAVWINNSGKYGPHKTLSSSGNVIGTKLAPHETGIQVIAAWVPYYYNTTYCDPVEALAKGYKEFGIKTADDLTKADNIAAGKVKSGYYSLLGESDLKDIKKVMENAFYKAYPSQKGKKISEEYPSNDIRGWTVKGIKNKTYTGKAIKQKITVVKNGKKATFKATYKNNKNAGKAKVIIKGTGKYTGTVTKTFTIKKAANKMKVKTTALSVGYYALLNSAQMFDPISVSKAAGKVSFKKLSGSAYFVVNSKGVVNIASGLGMGTYTLKVKVHAKGNKNYKAKTKNVSIKITVK